MASPTDLPPNVRRLVDEIESEIGETSVAIDDITGSRGREREGEEAADNGRVEAAVRRILEEIGEDPDRQGLLGTPERVHRMYTELTAGYHVDPERLINNAIFDVDYSEMVIVKDIPFYSLCEHHLLPFFGTAAVAYIPRGRVIGLSKIPRIVEMYARRLQVQERLTQQVAEFLQDRLAPQGVGVVMEATHLCAVMRGVRKPGTIMTTSSVLGLFRPVTARVPNSSTTWLAGRPSPADQAAWLTGPWPSVHLGDRDLAGTARDLDQIASVASAMPVVSRIGMAGGTAQTLLVEVDPPGAAIELQADVDPARPLDPKVVRPATEPDRDIAARLAEGEPELIDAARQLERAEVERGDLALELARPARRSSTSHGIDVLSRTSVRRSCQSHFQLPLYWMVTMPSRRRTWGTGPSNFARYSSSMSVAPRSRSSRVPERNTSRARVSPPIGAVCSEVAAAGLVGLFRRAFASSRRIAAMRVRKSLMTVRSPSE